MPDFRTAASMAKYLRSKVKNWDSDKIFIAKAGHRAYSGTDGVIISNGKLRVIEMGMYSEAADALVNRLTHYFATGEWDEKWYFSFYGTPEVEKEYPHVYVADTRDEASAALTAVRFDHPGIGMHYHDRPNPYNLIKLQIK